MTPSILYLHGLLSSPASTRARFLEQRLVALGLIVEIPDLAQGDFHRLTTSRAVSQALTVARGMTPPLVLMGSSFGGRVALHAAAALGDAALGPDPPCWTRSVDDMFREGSRRLRAEM